MSSLEKSMMSAILATAILSVAAESARAGFVYDLRLTGTSAASSTISANGKTANVTGVAPGATYTMQLWGQIIGDTNLTNDGFLSGYFGLQSSGGGSGGAITSGGVTAITSNTTATLANHAGQNNGTMYAGADTLTDVGSIDTTKTTNWAAWNAGTTGTPYASGTAVAGQSQQVAGNPNGSEILLGTYTVTLSGVGAQGASAKNTTYTPNAVVKITTSPTAASSLSITQDGVVQTGKGSGATLSVISALQGVTFTVDQQSGSTQTDVKKIALAASLAALNDASDQDNYAASGSTNAVTQIVNAFAPQTALSNLSKGVIDVHFASPVAGAPIVVLTWGSTDLSGTAIGSGTIYNPETAAVSVPNIDSTWLNANYAGWKNMLVFQNAQALDTYLGLNLPSSVTGIAIVPEPATLGLLALGALGLLSRKRK